MTTHSPKPTFFILGAPKCGTTAIAQYLSDHSDIFFSEPKEAEYFTDYARSRARYASEADYLEKCFAGARGYKAVGTGPTRLLRSPEAVPRILDLNSETKFIVMLRNPVEMFESLYWQRVYEGKETAPTPEAAWEKHKQIDTSRPREAGDTDAGELRYGEICRTGEQLERVFEQAGEDRVLVIFYDDLKKDPKAVYQKTLSFLSVADDGRSNFPVIHRRKATRSPLARRLIKWAGRFKKALGIRRSLRNLPLLQRMIDGSKPLSGELKQELIQYFRNDVEKLEELTGRDLTTWKQL